MLCINIPIKDLHCQIKTLKLKIDVLDTYVDVECVDLVILRECIYILIYFYAKLTRYLHYFKANVQGIKGLFHKMSLKDNKRTLGFGHV